MTGLRLFAVGALIAGAFDTPADGKDLRPFTVSDSIAVTQIMDPPIARADVEEIKFNFSPNHHLLVVVTRSGNLHSGFNEYALRLYRESDILSALKPSKQPTKPPYSVVISFATSSYKHAIEQVQWAPDSKRIAFVGRDSTETGQVYSYDVETRKLQQLTRHPTDIVACDVSWQHQILVFSAYRAKDWTERNRRGYTVRTEFSFELGTKDPSETVRELSHHIVNMVSDQVTHLPLPPTVFPHPFSISPSGRWAITLAQVHKIPTHWRRYDFFRRELPLDQAGSPSALSQEESEEYDDAFGGPAPWINQYVLVDLTTGKVQPLLDAPAIVFGIFARAIWSDDESSVILPSTYLPLDGDFDAVERERRRLLRAIAQVDRRTFHVQRVADQPEFSPDGRPSPYLKSIEHRADGSLIVRQSGSRNEDIVTRYTNTSGTWIEARDGSIPLSADTQRLQMSVVQDMNTSPDIVARDAVSGHRIQLTDLNPQLREVSLGTVELFDWTDRLGRRFLGGLLLPPGFKKGTRYPVVIQTYGFDPSEFLLDGPDGITTAYAARSLANKGFLVLQVPELEHRKSASTLGSFEESSENPLFVAGLEAAVETLDARGLIDPAKVGLIGFSREGMHVHYAVTFSKIAFAAAVISDSLTATPLSYVLAYGYPRPGMLEWESNPAIIGAPLWGEGVELWLQRSPLFHLDRIRTPLRLEATGIGVPALWETFAILKRHQRPVELVHIPGDSHVLQTPWGRYTSQQGTVDWFTFWLRGEEDSDPRKISQYKYWRILRRQHKGINPSATSRSEEVRGNNASK